MVRPSKWGSVKEELSYRINIYRKRLENIRICVLLHLREKS